MLRDPKAHALAEQFGGQWLQFRALESVTRDRDKFPDFEDYLRLSMKEETERFFEHIIREDRSVLDFIDARYSFINERLARHYGLTGVSGPEFRRVDLTGSPRGGIVTHASVLTVSSYATRTSPVLRGKWILDNLLNAPPPEPPPMYPTSTRSRSAHGLHARTARGAPEEPDMRVLPPADGSARLRARKLRRGRRVADDGWQFPGGCLGDAARTGESSAALRSSGPSSQATARRSPRPLRGKLLTYALGRGLERYDMRTVRLIASRLPRHDYRFSGLVLEIANSLPFQSRAAGDARASEASRASKSTACQAAGVGGHGKLKTGS